MINVTTQSGYFRGRAAQVWIAIMFQIACGQMTTDGVLLPEPRLLRLVHGSDDLPEDTGGVSMEQYEVLSELRGGARMHRDWATREGRETPPMLSKYRVIHPEITLEWKLKVRFSYMSRPSRRRG